MAFTPNSDFLAAAGADGRAYIWALATHKIVVTLHDPGSKGIRAVAFSFDHKYLAAADGNGDTYLWATPADKLAATLPDPASRGVNAVAFSKDGKLATGDSNGHVYRWSHAHARQFTDPGDSLRPVVITGICRRKYLLGTTPTQAWS